MQTNNDYQKRWLQTLLFKKNTLIQMLPITSDKELLKYMVISTNLCYTVSYENSVYHIKNDTSETTFSTYQETLNYMWNTVNSNT